MIIDLSEIESRIDNCSDFQKKVILKFLPILKRINDFTLKESSSVQINSKTIDILLNQKLDNWVIVFSLEPEVFKINIDEFDYLFFDNMDIEKAILLSENLLLGKLRIRKLLNKSGKIIQTKIEWDDDRLGEFDTTRKKIRAIFSKIDREVNERLPPVLTE